MASISKRGGAWRVRIIRKGYPPISKSFPTKRDAQAFAAVTESEMSRGVFKVPASVGCETLRDLMQRYKAEVTPAKRGRSKEDRRISCLLMPGATSAPLLDKALADLEALDVSRWRDARIKDVAPATLLREWAIFSHAIETARLEWGFAELRNPFKGVRKPAVRNRRDRRVSAAELAAICAATGSAELALMVSLAVETGARRGEILSLQWSAIDLQKRVAVLADDSTKNGHSRTLPLSPAALDLLRSMPRRLDGGPVFTLRPDSVSQGFGRAVARARRAYEAQCAQAGTVPDPNFLTDLRFHDTRHEACSRLAEKGFSTLEIASVSGHRTLQLLTRYVHLRPEALAEKLAATA